MSRKGKPSSKLASKLRTRRIFSDTFKHQKVKEINDGLLSILEVSKLYKVSKQSVYRWLYKYSPYHQKGVTQVVQMESEAQKVQELLQRVLELEGHLGRKQLELEYWHKLIEVSSKELKIDLKKNFDTQHSTSSTKNKKKEATK